VLNDALGGLGVTLQVLDDHLDRHVGLVHFPAIVVGDHRHRGVGDLGFAGALGLAEIGHADDVVAKFMIGERLGAGAKGGTFHVHISAAVVDAGLCGLGGLEQQLAQLLANGLGKGDVRDDAAAKKRVLEVALGAVKELVGQDDVARAILGLERADGANADDPMNIKGLHRPQVGAVVQLAGEDTVTARMTGEEDDFAPSEPAREKFVRRVAKRGFNLHPLLMGKSLDVVQATAADDPDAIGCHAEEDNEASAQYASRQMPSARKTEIQLPILISLTAG